MKRDTLSHCALASKSSIVTLAFIFLAIIFLLLFFYKSFSVGSFASRFMLTNRKLHFMQ